ncbi:MAG: EF-hand domain-containing protein [Chitinispirillaceae bacterium]|nr:EF-hand domain-containing protein [Chitinispirillaceae bacterium]
MISGIGSTGGYDLSAMASRIFNQLDTNSDESIDKAELQTLADTGTHFNVEQIMAGLDTNADGKIDVSETENSLKKLGEQMQKRLSRHMQPPDPSELFSRTDTNGDGGIDLSEFAVAGPKDVDEQQAGEMFSVFDANGDGSITEAEYTAAMEQMSPTPGGMPPPGGPPPQNMVSDSSDDNASTTVAAAGSTTDGNSIRQLLDVLMSSETDDDDEDDESVRSIKQLIEELQNGMTYGNRGSLSVGMSSMTTLFSITG